MGFQPGSTRLISSWITFLVRFYNYIILNCSKVLDNLYFKNSRQQAVQKTWTIFLFFTKKCQGRCSCVRKRLIKHPCKHKWFWKLYTYGLLSPNLLLKIMNITCRSRMMKHVRCIGYKFSTSFGLIAFKKWSTMAIFNRSWEFWRTINSSYL